MGFKPRFSRVEVYHLPMSPHTLNLSILAHTEKSFAQEFKRKKREGRGLLRFWQAVKVKTETVREENPMMPLKVNLPIGLGLFQNC